MQRLYRYVKLLVSTALALSLVTGCGSNPVSASYPLDSVTENGSAVSRVYRAENKTVPEVAQGIANERAPKEISKEDPERMFLVYPDELYHLQRDPQKPSDTLIEVSSKEFVRQNYNPGFLEGFLLASIMHDFFDALKYPAGNYRGYTSKDVYKPRIDYHKPTEQEKKQAPPITRQGTGSIIKRSDTPASSGSTVGSGGSITKKQPDGKSDTGTPPGTGGTGTITKSPGESSGSVSGGTTPKSGSSFSPPKNNSPPKTKVGGSGSITKRR